MKKYEFSSTCWTLEDAREICEDIFNSVPDDDDDLSRLDLWPLLDCANQISEAFDIAIALKGKCQDASKDCIKSPEDKSTSEEFKKYDVIDLNSGVEILKGVPSKIVHIIIESYDQPLQINIHAEKETRSVKSYSKIDQIE